MNISSISRLKWGLLVLAIFLILIGGSMPSCSSLASTNNYSPSSSRTESFKEIAWPGSSPLAAMLPTPPSTWGKYSTDSSTSLFVFFGNISREQYNNYVDACIQKGFNVDYSKSENWYNASNVGGYRLRLSYTEDESYMVVELSAPKITSPDETAPSASTPEEQAEPVATPAPTTINGDITPTFKEAMDSYEAFFDEYLAFLKKYEESNYSPTLLGDYTKFMSQYTETMGKIDAIDEESLSPADEAYYLEVMGRINQKLASAI